MPTFTVTAAGADAGVDEAALARSLAALPPDAPVIVMIHGFRFQPGDPVHCPHRHILSMTPATACRTAISWPRHLGAGRGGGGAPLCIGLGWPARGTIWQAWRAADKAGRALDGLVRAIRRHRTGPVQVMAHSLGARVALLALASLPAGSIGRMILLSGAAFSSEAHTALSSPAGRAAEVINVTSRENDLFDALLELALCAPGRSIGRGLGEAVPGWLDLQSDSAATRAGLARLGHRLAAPKRRICHWSGYLRPGLFPLYRRLLTRPDTLPLALLRAALPQSQSGRWPRIGGLTAIAGFKPARPH